MIRRITWRIGLPFISLMLVVLGSLGGFLAVVIRSDTHDLLVSNLENEAWIAAEASLPTLLGQASPDVLAKRMGTQIDARITIITADGTVVGDSELDPPTMENHATRPEVRDALISGRGESSRYSATMRTQMEYVAVPIVSQGEVLGVARAGLPLTLVEDSSQNEAQTVIWATIIAVMAATLVAGFIARQITRPIRDLTDAARGIASGKWGQTVRVRTRDEVGELAHTFNEMSLNLQRDITERERAEEERERTRAFIQTVIDGLPESLMVINRDFSIALANQTVREIAGGNGIAGGNDPVAASLKCHQVSHRSETPCAGEGHRCPLEQVFATKVPITVEHIHADAAGNVVNLEVTAAPIFDEEGEVVQIIESCRDITERERAEEALRENAETIRSIVDTSQDWIWSIDLQGIHTYSNPAMERILGYSPDEVVGKPSFGLMHEKDRQMIETEFPHLISERRGWRGLVLRWRHKDGSWRYLESSAVPMIDVDGDIVGFRGVDRDITDRQRAEDELRDSRDRLRNLTTRLDEVREEERTILARELHDEVGQAMTALRMDLAMVEEGLPAGEGQLADRLHSMIEMAQDSVDRVNRMSAELRPPILDILGLEDAVESEVWEYQKRWGAEIDLKLELGEVEALPERDLTLYRILKAALSNVRQHAQASRVEVSLRVAGERVVLEVLDDGIGIPDEQIHGLRSFGLIGMRERVQRLGGTIEIERREEGGTRLRAEVPVA